MKKIEMSDALLDNLSVLVSAYETLDIIFRYGVEKGLTNSECENLEALVSVLNKQFDQTTEGLYQRIDAPLKNPATMGSI